MLATSSYERWESAIVTGHPQRFFFVHLQKTGGSSLTRRIKHHFGIEHVYPNKTDGRTVGGLMVHVDHLLVRWKDRGDQIRVVAGHFPYCTMQLLDSEFTTLTLLRDPIERILACLRFAKKTDPADRHRSLEEIYDDPHKFHSFFHNHMVKMWSLTTDEMARPEGAVTHVEFTREHLDRAKRNLATVEALGFQEQFDDFCSELSSRFGWDLGRPVHTNRTKPSTVSDALRQRIATDNALDVEFHEFARRLHLERRGLVAADER